jgi:hypothetical protein
VPVRNFIGANMSFRRSALATAGGFRTDLGRVGTRPLGCEETELCLRLTASRPEAVLLHQPDAVVRHHVPPQRGTWHYYLTRCYGEGLSKAAVTARTGAHRALASERAYLRRTVPRAVTDALRPGPEYAPPRGLALCAGVSTTVLGYAVGTLYRLTPRRPAVAEAGRGRLLRPLAVPALLSTRRGRGGGT